MQVEGGNSDSQPITLISTGWRKKCNVNQKATKTETVFWSFTLYFDASCVGRGTSRWWIKIKTGKYDQYTVPVGKNYTENKGQIIGATES